MMRYFTLFLILLAAQHNLSLEPNLKQNFCQQNRCLTCIGRYCTTTCQGESCKNCPLGDCCDGSICNICRGDSCCKTRECNICITNCLKKCEGKATCHYDCFQECIPNGNNIDTTQENINSGIGNRNYLPVNVTTIINITNTIKNENFIRAPITVNTTNINNHTARGGHYHRKQVIINGQNQTRKFNCCDVIHPEICNSIQELSNRLCYTKKHKECSQLCVSNHVHLVQNKEANNNTCITIAIAPYFYCGKYVIEKCDSCYNCSEGDGLECAKQAECSETCKSSIIPENFYNRLYRKE